MLKLRHVSYTIINSRVLKGKYAEDEAKGVAIKPLDKTSEISKVVYLRGLFNQTKISLSLNMCLEDTLS